MLGLGVADHRTVDVVHEHRVATDVDVPIHVHGLLPLEDLPHPRRRLFRLQRARRQEAYLDWCLKWGKTYVRTYVRENARRALPRIVLPRNACSVTGMVGAIRCDEWGCEGRGGKERGVRW